MGVTASSMDAKSPRGTCGGHPNVGHYGKLAFRRTQHFEASLGCPVCQATFLSYSFLSNRAKCILSELNWFQNWFWFLQKRWKFLTLGWHFLEGFRLDVLQQHVLRNASLKENCTSKPWALIWQIFFRIIKAYGSVVKARGRNSNKSRSNGQRKNGTC